MIHLPDLTYFLEMILFAFSPIIHLKFVNYLHQLIYLLLEILPTKDTLGVFELLLKPDTLNFLELIKQLDTLNIKYISRYLIFTCYLYYLSTTLKLTITPHYTFTTIYIYISTKSKRTGKLTPALTLVPHKLLWRSDTLSILELLK